MDVFLAFVYQFIAVDPTMVQLVDVESLQAKFTF